MQTEIKVGTWWVYLGPGDGRNTKHRVTSNDKKEITTISDPNDMRSAGGWSWLGPVSEFTKHFRPVA